MIYEFTDMKTAQAQADSIPQPKSVWWDISRIVVRTGDDIPKDPT